MEVERRKIRSLAPLEQPGSPEELRARQLITFVVLLMVAFVYVWRKGALDWK